MSEYELDAKNILCPMPVIRTQDKVNTLQHGDKLKVICTDPGALNDIPAWCRINGHKVLKATQTDDEVILLIEVGNGT
jgi:tRNA 2-thiouridine synthesizing protein A